MTTTAISRDAVEQALRALLEGRALIGTEAITDVGREIISIARAHADCAIDGLTAALCQADQPAVPQPEPQAQAGEPDVHHTINGEEFITLQAHREAITPLQNEMNAARLYLREQNEMLRRIAKKDAALRACVEALKSADIGNTEPYEKWKGRRDDAIAQAQGVLG